MKYKKTIIDNSWNKIGREIEVEPKAVVNLRKGEGRTIKAGGLWIFDNEIESVMGSVEDGDIVIVRDFDGYPMGRGFINRKSKITVRMLTRDAEQDINEAFLRMTGQECLGISKSCDAG